MKRKYIIALLVALLLYGSERIADSVWGDGDGMITQYHLHTVLLGLIVCVAIYALLGFMNLLYVKFFRSRVSPHKANEWLGKITVVLLICFLSFMVLELLSRLFFPAAGTFDRLYPVENARSPVPYQMFKGKPFSKTGFGNEVYNAHGYRGPYPPMPKPQNEFRIIMTGGSALWDGDTTLTQRIENKFRQNDMGFVKVYNFGVVSANSSMELVTVLTEIENLHADLVVMYNGANDIIHPFYYDPRPGYPFNFLVLENNPLLMRTFPLIALVACQSNLCRLLLRDYFTEKFSRLSALRKECGYDTDAWRKEIASVYKSNTLNAWRSASNSGAGFIAMIQPVVFDKSNPSPTEKDFADSHKAEKIHYEKTFAYFRHETESNVTGQLKLEFLHSVFGAEGETCFRDNVHLAPRGAALLSEAVFKKLQFEVNQSLAKRNFQTN